MMLCLESDEEPMDVLAHRSADHEERVALRVNNEGRSQSHV